MMMASVCWTLLESGKVLLLLFLFIMDTLGIVEG